jgi:diaminopimelate epimerase
VTFAREVRHSPRYGKEGINVNLVEITGPASIAMRTYERGVEDETLSCGTGVTAAAISFGSRHPDVKEVSVKTKGGDLEVSFLMIEKGVIDDIWLKGPAQKVFEGEINI